MSNEALVEEVALGLLNSDRAMAGLPPVSSRVGIRDSEGYVVNARAIIPIVQRACEAEPINTRKKIADLQCEQKDNTIGVNRQ